MNLIFRSLIAIAIAYTIRLKMLKPTQFLVLWLALLLLPVSVSPAAELRINADEAYRRVVAGELTLIDIRAPQEWEKSGIPKGSLAITMHNPSGKEAFRNEILKAIEGDSSRPIALICAVGGRSRWAQKFLAKSGFSNVQDVSEGMFGRGKQMPGWLKRGLPVEPCPNC